MKLNHERARSTNSCSSHLDVRSARASPAAASLSVLMSLCVWASPAVAVFTGGGDNDPDEVPTIFVPADGTRAVATNARLFSDFPVESLSVDGGERATAAFSDDDPDRR